MAEFSILTDAFAEAAAEACERARQRALASGRAVVFVDEAGRFVEERPDGRIHEVRLDASARRESHRVVLRELTHHAA